MRIILFLLLIMTSFLAWSKTSNMYTFNDPVKENEFYTLIKNYRCLVCQNENLASSSADLANDLRHKVYQLVMAGKSKSMIDHYLVKRYGDFILYDPPLQNNTIILWFGPLILLLIGLGVMIYFIVKQLKSAL